MNEHSLYIFYITIVQYKIFIVLIKIINKKKKPITYFLFKYTEIYKKDYGRMIKITLEMMKQCRFIKYHIN